MKIVKVIFLIFIILLILGIALIIYKKISNNKKSQEIINSRSVEILSVSYQEIEEIILYKGKSNITFFLSQQSQASLVKKLSDGMNASKDNVEISTIDASSATKNNLTLEKSQITTTEGYGVKIYFSQPVTLTFPGQEDEKLEECDGLFFDMDNGTLYLSKSGIFCKVITLQGTEKIRNQNFSRFIKEIAKEFKTMEGIGK